MSAVFLVKGIILMFFYSQGEKKAIECFLRFAGDFVGVSMVIGIARGINLTLNDGKISDSILNSLSGAVENLPELAFAVILFIIFIFMGFFIQSSSGLAILSMPVFAPLADKVGLSRATVVNTYMFGEYMASFVTPTGLVLIVFSMVEIEYSYWIKFIWPFIIIIFVLLIFFRNDKCLCRFIIHKMNMFFLYILFSTYFSLLILNNIHIRINNII